LRYQIQLVPLQPGKFEAFYLRFIIIKFIAIIICLGMLTGFWYSILTFSKIQSTTVAGVTTSSGGNLLTRSGAICDASKLAFEESFDAQYRWELRTSCIRLTLSLQAPGFNSRA
jgi:hypothetical protein